MYIIEATYYYIIYIEYPYIYEVDLYRYSQYTYIQREKNTI